MSFPGRPPSARLRRIAAFWLLAALLLAPTATLNAAPPLPAPAQVSLKGGHLLTGTVTKSVKIEGKPFSVIQTDFGEILAPQSEITGTVPAVEAGDTFLASEVRIIRLAGTVERRSAGAQEWTKVGPLDPEFTGQPRPRILPGDTVRTGADGQLDVMLHRDAWVRLQADTEVEFSTAAAKGSLSLLRGAMVQDVTGRPRGQTFRVTTPSTTLGVRGTRFGVFVDTEKQGVAVLKGVVRVGAGTDVAEGQEGIWTDPATVTVSPLSEERRRLLDVKIFRVPVDDMAFVPAGVYPIGLPDRSVPGKETAWSVFLHFQNLPGGMPNDSNGRRMDSGFEGSGAVKVGAFLIDRREAAQEEFASFLASQRRSEAGAASVLVRDREPALMALDQAQSFAQWAGKALPTATQWQIAARGRDARIYPWGMDVTPAHRNLVLGEWGSNVWIPPVNMPVVDAQTMDVSPFGTRAMLSSAPEWARELVSGEPIWPLLSESVRWDTVARRKHVGKHAYGVICGEWSSLFCIRTVESNPSSGPETRVGLRCVIDLGGR